MIEISKMFGFLSYMKFDQLRTITIDMFANTDMATATEVNIFIDASSFVERLFSPEVEAKDPTMLASAVVNLAGHLRLYFRSVHGTESQIFIVYSKNNWNVLKKLLPEWNSHNINKYETHKFMAQYIKDSMKMVEMVCKYLPRVYYITSEAETSAMIYGHILNERAFGNNNPNIILTREPNMLQIPGIDPHTVIYYKHTHLRDKFCFGINQSNVMMNFLKLTGRYNPVFSNPDAMVLIYSICDDITKVNFVEKSKRTVDLAYEISRFNPKHLSHFIALTNLGSRWVKFLLNWPVALKAINKINDDLQIMDNLEFYNKLDFYTKIFEKIGYHEFDKRLKCISIQYQSNLYINTPYFKSFQKVDLNNGDELKYVNDHFFKDNYITLDKF